MKNMKTNWENGNFPHDEFIFKFTQFCLSKKNIANLPKINLQMTVM